MSDNDNKWACKQHHNEFMLRTNPHSTDLRKYGGYVESCPACVVADAERVRCENQRARAYQEAPLFRERAERWCHAAAMGRTVIHGGVAAPAVAEDRYVPPSDPLVDAARAEAARIRLGEEKS